MAEFNSAIVFSIAISIEFSVNFLPVSLPSPDCDSLLSKLEALRAHVFELRGSVEGKALRAECRLAEIGALGVAVHFIIILRIPWKYFLD